MYRRRWSERISKNDAKKINQVSSKVGFHFTSPLYRDLTAINSTTLPRPYRDPTAVPYRDKDTRKSMKTSQSDLSVCVIGNSRCGKTTFIRNLFGGERLQATNDTKTILQSTSYKLKQTSKIKITELLMPSSNRSRTVFQNHFDPFEFDLFFVFTDSWFTENIMWTVRLVFKVMLLCDSSVISHRVTRIWKLMKVNSKSRKII